MSSRHKSRGSAAKEDSSDAQEEQALWQQISKDVERCKSIHKRQQELTLKIKDLNEEYVSRTPSSSELEHLQGLLREVIKLSNEEQTLLNEEPAGLINNVTILQALRTASQNDSESLHRHSSSSKPRKGKLGRLDTDSAIADSPGPSPSIVTSRLKGSSARSASVASARDRDDGTEANKGPGAEKAGKFTVGAEVAYKQAKPKEDGSLWIQCIIIGVTQSGNKKSFRYEVQDAVPDEDGAQPDVYTASANSLIAIPLPDTDLPEYPVGKSVLARYPMTTAFYRAEVTGTKKNYCRLKFEDDQNQEMEVERRFVLSLDK